MEIAPQSDQPFAPTVHLTRPLARLCHDCLLSPRGGVSLAHAAATDRATLPEAATGSSPLPADGARRLHVTFDLSCIKRYVNTQASLCHPSQGGAYRST